MDKNGRIKDKYWLKSCVITFEEGMWKACIASRSRAAECGLKDETFEEAKKLRGYARSPETAYRNLCKEIDRLQRRTTLVHGTSPSAYLRCRKENHGVACNDCLKYWRSYSSKNRAVVEKRNSKDLCGAQHPELHGIYCNRLAGHASSHARTATNDERAQGKKWYKWKSCSLDILLTALLVNGTEDTSLETNTSLEF